MNYRDSLGSGGFQRTVTGGLAFYPWGKFGRGYFVSGPTDLARIRRTVKVYLMAGLIVVLANGLLWKLHAEPLWKAGGLLAVGLLLVVFQIHIRSWNLEPAPEAFVVPDNTESFAAGFNVFGLWFMLLVCTLFAALGLFVLLHGGPLPASLVWTAIFGTGVMFFGRIALIRRRVKRRARE